MARATLLEVWDDRFREYDFGPGHPFTQTSRWLAHRLLEESGSLAGGAGSAVVRVRKVDPAPREVLLSFHRPGYLDLVERLSDSGSGELLDRGDTPSFPGCYEASARVAGGTLRALSEISEGGAKRAVNLSGGLHHAQPQRASGFCIFNDVALAVAGALRPRGKFSKVAYVDIDAHHGDGVMYGFYGSGRLLDIDFHQDGRTLFPGTGEVGETGRADGSGLKVNVPLPPWSGDEAFVPLFERIVPPLVRSFRPGLIILQHGTDAHADDKLAQLEYTPRSYTTAVRTLRMLADELCEGRLLMTGGGGYTSSNVARVLARSVRELLEPPQEVPDSSPTPARWRTEYEAAFDAPAPTDFRPPRPAGHSPWSADRTDRLVHELSERLGFKLP
ncbi:MAG: acetoin utilization protein AcuC [Thermoplasmata archaeon]|nr:acetoin utilization protein AcuC [Thermoplasmata archaeon]